MKTPPKEFWDKFKNTEGAFSTAEAIALYNICLDAPEGDYVELGTHKGKSAMVAAAALKDGIFSLVEPEFDNSEWTQNTLTTVASTTKNTLAIMPLAEYSPSVIQKFSRLSFVFVDSGSHQDGLPMQEVRMLEDRMVSGGIIAFHDYQSQFSEVEQAYNYLVSTGKYTPISIDWRIINDYVKENDLEKENISWHHTELESPNFLGAVRRK